MESMSYGSQRAEFSAFLLIPFRAAPLKNALTHLISKLINPPNFKTYLNTDV